jgi:hypothetical protein
MMVACAANSVPEEANLLAGGIEISNEDDNSE